MKKPNGFTGLAAGRNEKNYDEYFERCLHEKGL